MKTILVTGGGGFIGSNLVAELINRQDYNTVVCDHFGADDKWRNLKGHTAWDIIHPADLDSWLEDNAKSLEMVYHLGSISSTTERDIDLILKTNLGLSLKLWRWCNKHEVRFVYTSAAATYGDGSQGFEDDISLSYLKQLKPLSGYGWSKHLFDCHVATCLERGDIRSPQWVGLKMFNTYGPNEYHKGDQKSVICQIAPAAIHGGSIKLFRSYNPRYPDGGQMRDVIYVKDAVRVMLWLLDHPEVSGLYNLGTGTARSFNDMARAIFTALNRQPSIHYYDMPETLIHNYQYFTEARMQRLKSAGYADAFTSVEDGVKDYVLNYLVKDDPYL